MATLQQGVSASTNQRATQHSSNKNFDTWQSLYIFNLRLWKLVEILELEQFFEQGICKSTITGIILN